MKGPVQTRQTPNQTGDNRAPDFSEYVWMAEELEEFDKKVEEEFWEEQFIERCFEELLGDEDDDGTWYAANQQQSTELVDAFKYLDVSQTPSQSIPIVNGTSKLNPEAPEFVPRSYGSDDS